MTNLSVLNNKYDVVTAIFEDYCKKNNVDTQLFMNQAIEAFEAASDHEIFNVYTYEHKFDDACFDDKYYLVGVLYKFYFYLMNNYNYISFAKCELICLIKHLVIKTKTK